MKLLKTIAVWSLLLQVGITMAFLIHYEANPFWFLVGMVISLMVAIVGLAMFEPDRPFNL